MHIAFTERGDGLRRDDVGQLMLRIQAKRAGSRKRGLGSVMDITLSLKVLADDVAKIAPEG